MKKNLKVIYTSYQPYSILMGEKLLKRYGWQPVYWITNTDAEKAVRKKFSGVITHFYANAIKGIPPAGIEPFETGTIDEKLLNALSFHESIAMNMMERNDSTDSFSYRERLSLYHYHLSYWLGIFNRLKPDVIVFEEEPHQAVDYVMYALARHLGIETIMFVRTSFTGRMFPVNVFENGSEIIKNNYVQKIRSGKKPALPFAKDIAFFLNKLKGNYQEVQNIQLYDQVDKIAALKEGKAPVNEKGFSFYLNILRKLTNVFQLGTKVSNYMTRFDVNPDSDQKEKDKSIRLSKMTYMESDRIRKQTLKKKLELKQYYEQLTEKKPDLTKPYILCALSYQPEKTTSPMGGHYVNQILMVELLRKTMPADWTLYVKDHISQFSWYTQFGEQHRSAEFYKRIHSLPNTKLVSLFFDTFTLVDNCKAIATVTGSIGFEAVIRKKPVLTFGHPWYKFCEGVFYSGDGDELKKQIELIQKGYTPDEEKVNLYIETIQENTFPGVVGGMVITKQAGEAGLPENNSEAHIESIISILHYNEKHSNHSQA